MIYFSLISAIDCEIRAPANIKSYVGGNVTFQWNITGNANCNIRLVQWGLKDNLPSQSSLSTILIEISNQGKPSLKSNLNHWYKDRISFVGSAPHGYFWFDLINLRKNDSRTYGAATFINGQASANVSSVYLHVTGE